VLASASVAEVKLAQLTLDKVRVPRRKGRPKKRPERVVADKAYDSDGFRKCVRSKGKIPCIPPRSNRRCRGKKWEQEYKGR